MSIPVSMTAVMLDSDTASLPIDRHQNSPLSVALALVGFAVLLGWLELIIYYPCTGWN
jgi:hypothetical protein